MGGKDIVSYQQRKFTERTNNISIDDINNYLKEYHKRGYFEVCQEMNDDKKCRGKLELSDGTVLKKVEYDDFSKFMS